MFLPVFMINSRLVSRDQLGLLRQTSQYQKLVTSLGQYAVATQNLDLPFSRYISNSCRIQSRSINADCDPGAVTVTVYPSSPWSLSNKLDLKSSSTFIEELL